MQECLAKIQEHEFLIRHPGGLWASDTVNWKYWGTELVPEWHFSTSTIEALIKRKLIKAWDTKTGFNNKPYPVKVKRIKIKP